MGFPTSLIVGSGSVLDEFVCAVCCQLAEEPLYTACAHVFCQACLTEWLSHKAVCPKCNFTLNYHQVGALKTECPLAWRLLGRLRCRCPLFGASCQWEGDYSELGAHLTSSDTHLADAKGAASAASAAALNEQANGRFLAAAHRDAIKLYSKAISLMPATVRAYIPRLGHTAAQVLYAF
jgi:DnaJ family protein C protein 7